jgi:hypothetical protein
MISEGDASDAPQVRHIADPLCTRLTTQRFAIALRDKVEHERLDVGFDEHGFAFNRADFTVDPDQRTRLRRKVQGRRAARGRNPEEAIDARRVQGLGRTNALFSADVAS